jgi:hypothetical protein
LISTATIGTATIRAALHERLAGLVAAAGILVTCGCTVPLAPGFHIEREEAQAQYVPAEAPILHVRAVYHAVNSGNAPLSEIGAVLPNPAKVARQNLRVTADGAEASVEEVRAEEAHGSSEAFEIHLAKPWTEKQQITIEISFDITASNGHSVLLAANGFAVDNPAWFPRLEAPKRLLAKGEERADMTEVSIWVPRDFTALSAGQALGKKPRDNQLEYRFRVRRYDPEPFLIAGRYNQQSAKASDAAVYFWTFAGLSAEATQRAGREMAAAAAFFDSTFGERSKRGKPPIWIVESPVAAKDGRNEGAARSQTLPNVVVLAGDAVAQDIGHGEVTDAELTLLAETWTRWSAFPRAEERFLGPSLATYAVNAWHDARDGESGRRARIAELLRADDAERAASATAADTAASRARRAETMSREKASLFLAALDDECGASRVHQALAYSLTTLRGREYGYDDLRAGLHAEGCEHLGPTFREWLNQPGIPEEFRNRYATGNAGAVSGNAKMER